MTMDLKRKPAILVALLALALSGCATEALKLAPNSPDQPWVPQQEKSKPDGQQEQSKQNSDFSLPANPELALIANPVAANTNETYDLAKLIDLAQRSNPSTRNAWEKARQAALAVGMTEALTLPLITANVIGGSQKTTTPIDIPIIGRKDINTKIEGTAPFLALTWLAFDFGQRAALTEAAKHISFAANVGFNAMHQKVIFDVSRTYYEYCAAVSGNRIAKQTLRNSKAVLAAVQARLNEGQATTLELALARQQLAQSELRIIKAEGQEQTTYQALLAAMGVNATLKIKVDGSLNKPLPANFGGVTENALEQALARRPDILASYSALQASKAGIKVAEAEFMPKVFVAGMLGTNSNSFSIANLPSIGNNSSGKGIFFGATVPLYDGGLRAAQLKNAQSTASAASETFRQAQLSAVAEIVLASNALKTALAANKAATVLASTSSTAFDAALEAYKNGLGTITTVNETNNALLDAKLAQTDAHAASLIAAANLAFFSGSLTSTRSLPGVIN